MTVREYDIHNLDCASCSAKIETEISQLSEVNRVNLDFFNKKLIVQFKDEKDASALDRLNKIARSIEPKVKISEMGSEHLHEKGAYSYVIYAGLLLLLVNYFFPIPEALQPWLYLCSYLMVSGRVLYNAVREVFSRQLLAEHFLMGIASIGAMYLGEYTEAIAVIALYEFGQYLESRSVEKSRRSVKSIISLKPEEAHLKIDEELKDIKLSEVQIGDILLVHPGERIPVDSIVISGHSTLDTSSVSGESAPLAVSAGDEIYAGCLNHDGLLEIRAIRKEDESMVSKILSLIDDAASRKSKQERFITRFASIYTPVVVALALLIFIIPVIMGRPVNEVLRPALVFLIVSCPCALVISIPLTYYIGIGLAARKGIIFKGSTFLDNLRKVNSIVFDKTGTLTTGDLKLRQLYPVKGVSEEELKEALYISEYNSKHPFAFAVKKAISGNYEEGKLAEFKELGGKGLRLNYDGKLYLVGSYDFIQSEGYQNLSDTEDNSAVHVAVDGIYLGAAGFSDEIKENMEPAIKNLKKYGVKKAYLLSGDNDAKVKSVSEALGLDGYKARLLPQDKLSALTQIMESEQGLVSFVGDGMNDAPVLAGSDIGIAMGGIGAQASIDSADIILLNDKPEQLVSAFKLSKLTNRKIKQNISLALGIKILVMALGVAGISGLWEAIIADVGVTLLVIFNSLSMSRKTLDT